ncbi:unnamed protein product [Durusdinium trenchii]|uniref:Uncharacterized protein n=1 Tax=Durusdinium trenchii TaxID=1381693 RepID=A0ABP0Q8M6_9DINO
MKARNLLVVLAFLSQFELPSRNNDFVEVCAGSANLSRAMRMSGYNGKEFDAVASRPTELWGTVDNFHTLYRPLNIKTQSKALVKKSVNKRTGQVQVTGQKRMLEASAHYPVSFGLAVAGLINPVGAPAPRPDISISEADPSDSDDGAIDDLIKGRDHAHWRRL